MEGTNLNSELKWLYVDMNSFFASVEQQRRPETRGRPLAVLPLMSDATCVIAASYEAKKFGVKTGTNVAEAKRMCPGLITVEANHQYYVEYHERIKNEIDKFIPPLTRSIDEFVGELQGKQVYEAEAVKLAETIKASIYNNVGHYVKCSIGISSNKYLAKIATDLKKPDGLTIIKPQDIYEKLCLLKLRDLPGVGYGIHEKLLANNITTTKQLLALDPKHMRKIWHSLWGEKMWYLLRGYELPEEETKRSTVGHSHVITPEMRPLKRAYVIAQRLMLKAASRMRRMEYYAKAMSLSIRIEKGERISIHKSFYRSCDNFSLHKELETLWYQATINLPPKTLIKKAAVTLFDLVPANEVQPELLDNINNDLIKRKRFENVSLAMDRLNAKYGRDTIVIGFTPEQSATFTGTKVAFTRIPEVAEFYE